MKKPRLSLIVAHTVHQRVIGNQGGMPWHLPADLAHFKAVTWGHPILMGRRTQEAIGHPLPGRPNLVISTQDHYHPEGYTVFADMASLWQQWRWGSELFVIGGGMLYAALLPEAERLFITEIHAQISGDTFFPPWVASDWQETSRREQAADDRNPYALSFTCWTRLSSVWPAKAPINPPMGVGDGPPRSGSTSHNQANLGDRADNLRPQLRG